MWAPEPSPSPDYSVYHVDGSAIMLVLADPDTAPAEVALVAHILFTECDNMGFTHNVNHNEAEVAATIQDHTPWNARRSPIWEPHCLSHSLTKLPLPTPPCAS